MSIWTKKFSSGNVNFVKRYILKYLTMSSSPNRRFSGFPPIEVGALLPALVGADAASGEVAADVDC